MAQLAAAAVKVIRALGIQLKANPYDYSAHISYIHALKEHEDRGGGVGGQDALEHARQHLRSVYPLSGTLWEEWISDTEVAQRASKSQPGEQRTDKIAGLYRCAFKDYLSVKLLLKYCKYMASKVNMTCTSTGNEEDAHNAANIGAVAAAREAYELALAHGGLHVSQGIHLWTSYVEFETAVCDMVEELEGGMNEGEGISNAPSGGQRVVVEQQNRVADVYKRALAIPLQGMEALRDMQQEWCDDNDRTADVNTTAEAYTRALTLREPLDALEGCLEAALQHEAKPKEATQDKAAEPVGASTGESSVAVYQRMIQHEIAYGDDPARVICVNERAIAANPLNIELWLAYTAYVERKLPTSTVLLDLCERSTRNCAWSSFLWQRRMRALERKNLAFHEIEGVFQAALLSGFPTPEEYVQLWLAFIDYQRRRIAWAELHAECDAAQDDSARERLREDTVYSLRETFQKASDYITVHFGKAVGDPYAQIPLGWARVELNGVQSVAHARAVLEAAAKDYPKNASVWLEYARFEMNETVFPACVAKVRKIYQTATEKTAGDYAVCQTWVQFERENGTLETYDSACARTEKAMEMARIRQEKHDEKERVKAQQQKEKAEIAQRATASKLADEQQTKEAKPAYTHEDVFAATEEHVVGAKGQKHTLDGTSEAVTDLKRQKTDTEEAVASSEKPAARVGTTVFLSNLSYQTAEQEITSLFDPDADASGSSKIKQVRIVKDKATGASKGYAYLDFKHTADAEQALLLDRTQKLHDRTVFVSVMNAPKYLPTVDANLAHVHGPSGHVGDGPRAAMTLFCKSLPPHSTIKSVSAMFAKYGEIISCRLGKGHDGKFKGFAFVEFKTEDEAKRALEALHNTDTGNSPLYVALSSDKSGAKKEKDANKPVAGRSSSAIAMDGIAAPVKSAKRLVPRMVKRIGKTPAPRIRPVSAKSANPNASSSPKAAEDDKVPTRASAGTLCNADFKSMLTKQ